ncbi:MAG: response regulator [Bdellovibrio sp.]
MKNLMLIEDDKNLREVLSEELQERGLNIQAYAEIPSLQGVEQPDGVLLDLRVGSENGLNFLRDLKAAFPEAKVVVMSGFGSVASAVRAMQLGAHSFIAKPVTADMILKSFSDKVTTEEEVPQEEVSLAKMEREYIDYILQSSDGNITQAAKKLGLHRQSLQRKLRKNIPNK